MIIEKTCNSKRFERNVLRVKKCLIWKKYRTYKTIDEISKSNLEKTFFSNFLSTKMHKIKKRTRLPSMEYSNSNNSVGKVRMEQMKRYSISYSVTRNRGITLKLKRNCITKPRLNRSTRAVVESGFWGRARVSFNQELLSVRPSLLRSFHALRLASHLRHGKK